MQESDILLSASSVCAHGARYFSYGQSLTSNAARNCRKLNKQTSRQLTSYLWMCHYWMGRRFVEGVHGHVSKVESMALRHCDRGDEATWYTRAVCGPGRLTRTYALVDTVVSIVCEMQQQQ